jgi:hypothetical protein
LLYRCELVVKIPRIRVSQGRVPSGAGALDAEDPYVVTEALVMFLGAEMPPRWDGRFVAGDR